MKQSCALITALLAMLAVGAWSADTCRPITQPQDNESYVQDHGLDKPGHYCLTEDIFVKGYRSWAEGRIFNVSKVIVNIGANDVVFDLAGRTAWSDGRLEAGFETTLAENNKPLASPPENIVIRNGELRLERSGIGIRFSGLGGLYDDKWPSAIGSDFPMRLGESATAAEKREMEDLHREMAADLWKILPISRGRSYPLRDLHIEQMRIRTQDAAAVLQGAGTVIRDSTIEVESGTALWIYGPGAVIENNTIIVNGHGDRNHPIVEADAPIRLIHGDGAVIRGNRIIVKGQAHKRIVSTFDTGAFTLEGNRFYGVTDKDEIAKAFRGSVQMTARRNAFEPAWKAWFERGTR